MRIIGLTGGIACGKSHVSDTLQRLGAFIVDGDVLSRSLTAPGGAALPDIRARFGDGVFQPDGQLNRRALAEVIFADDAERAALDGIMQPLLLTLIEEGIETARQEGAPLCVLDMPLLYEKGLDSLCDEVWCVTLPEDEQLRRLMARDALTEEQGMARIRSQMPTAEKATRADVVIDTSGSLEETERDIEELYRETLGLPRQRRRRSDRYQTQPEAVFAEETDTPAPQEPAESADRHRRSAVNPPSKPVSRPKHRRAGVFRWSWSAAACLLIAIAACVTVQALTSANLKQHRDAQEAAWQRVLNNHPLAYQSLIETYAAQNNLQPAFVEAIILNESSYQPTAVSNVGARGLMQLMPDTAEWIAQRMGDSGYSFEAMYDPETNIRYGTWYLCFLSDLFGGDPVAVTCAYHAGQNTVLGWQSNAAYLGADGQLSLELLPDGPTKTYARRVTRDYGVYQAIFYSPVDSPADDSDPAGNAVPG